MAIRVFVVEDHPIMRDTLVDYLRVTKLDVCGVAGSAEEALDGLGDANPDLVLLDLSLPGRSGLDLLTEIQSGACTPCIVLSGHREESYVGRAFAAGAKGYVLKGQPGDIGDAIRAVLAGGVYLSGSLRSSLDGVGA